MKLPSSLLPFVCSITLPFDTPSLRVLGKGYAAAYLDILGKSKR